MHVQMARVDHLRQSWEEVLMFIFMDCPHNLHHTST